VEIKQTMKKGFSFLELVIVLVIVGIISTLAMPSYAKRIEKSRGKNAEANLISIYNMEKRHKLDNGVYYECVTSPCAPNFICPVTACTTDCSNIINTDLGLLIRDPYFTYTIATEGITGYKATATRLATGPCSGSTMTITDGTMAITDGNVIRNCVVW